MTKPERKTGKEETKNNMFIIIGLGNPEKKYSNTRHNAGFLALDKIKEEKNFSEFKMTKKVESEISKGVIAGNDVILAKPQTYMNQSGRAVLKLVRKYARQKRGYLNFPNLLVINDDFSLPLGKIKFARNRGSAGHNGVESIFSELGSRNFLRLRIGIKPPGVKTIIDAEKFVLEKFSPEEMEVMGKTLSSAVEAVASFISEGEEKAVNKFNSRK